MYRYGDGTPFPLDENFIETITAAVEACTNAFMPLTELDGRRDRARSGRTDGERDLNRLGDLDKTLIGALAPFNVAERKGSPTQGVVTKILAQAKDAIRVARTQVESRVSALEAEAAASTAADAVLHALRPFFDNHSLPNAKWIMSWDVRGVEPQADAVMTAGKLQASFSLQVDNRRAPIKVGDLADTVIVHMMKKGLLGKAKPAPVDLSRYVLVAFEKTGGDTTVTLKEKPDKSSQGLRFIVNDSDASWQSINAAGDSESDANPLDIEDVGNVRRLAEGADHALGELVKHRKLVELSLGGQPLAKMPEPRVAPMEVLQQLTPLARTIREKSRGSGELVLKRDVAGGRREELFVPRAQLAHQFSKLPMEYRKPFEDMGVSSEDTQPAIVLPNEMRPPAQVTPGVRSIPPTTPPTVRASPPTIPPSSGTSTPAPTSTLRQGSSTSGSIPRRPSTIEVDPSLEDEVTNVNLALEDLEK